MLWILYNFIEKIFACDSRMSGVVLQTNKRKIQLLSFLQNFNASKISAYMVASQLCVNGHMIKHMLIV